jgi:hypothetical protein
MEAKHELRGTKLSCNSSSRYEILSTKRCNGLNKIKTELI